MEGTYLSTAFWRDFSSGIIINKIIVSDYSKSLYCLVGCHWLAYGGEGTLDDHQLGMNRDSKNAVDTEITR